MFRNFLKVAYRNLFRNFSFSVLNILGLSLGIACSIIILLYLQHELAYDEYHEKADRIYRLNAEYLIGDRIDQYANVPRPIGPTLKADYPEIVDAARIVKHNRYTGNPVFISNKISPDRYLEEDLVFAADSTFFNIFSYSFLQGDGQSALTAPNTAVISRRIAQKIFGDDNPLNQEILLDNAETFRITGLIEEVPETSHLKFEVMLSWTTYHSPRDLQTWLGRHMFTYVLFAENQQPAQFLSKWPAFYEKYMAETFSQINGKFNLLLQPLTDIHLHSQLQWEVAENGNVIYIYVFSAVGLFILLIACINYMNMATARSANRAAEVGVRKVLGSDRNLIVKQFYSESLLLTIFSLLFSFVIVAAALPTFNEISGKSLSFDLFSNPALIAGILIITIIVSLSAGFYPAMYLSSFQPAGVLKGMKAARRSAFLRKLLVIVQVAISIVIIIGTSVVNDQLTYTRQKDLGFNKNNVVAITLRDTLVEKNLPAIKETLMQHPGILKTATSYNIPGKDLNHTAMEIEIAAGEMEEHPFQFMQFDYDFIDLMEMQILAGRNFNETMGTDAKESVMINQAAVRKYGWQDPVGKRVRFAGSEDNLHVIGVVDDIHINSLHMDIEPVVMLLPERPGGKLYLRLAEEDISNTMNFIRAKWRDFDNRFPLDYVFLDENFFKQHEADQKLAKIFQYCAIIAIFISCLGLLGMSSYAAEQRTREIGVRKVLGASVFSIISLLSKDFMKLILIANLVAWPIAYFLMKGWLAEFAFHTEISLISFIIAALAAVGIALITISFQTVKAGLTNPVTSLRHE